MGKAQNKPQTRLRCLMHHRHRLPMEQLLGKLSSLKRNSSSEAEATSMGMKSLQDPTIFYIVKEHKIIEKGK